MGDVGSIFDLLLLMKSIEFIQVLPHVKMSVQKQIEFGGRYDKTKVAMESECPSVSETLRMLMPQRAREAEPVSHWVEYFRMIQTHKWIILASANLDGGHQQFLRWRCLDWSWLYFGVIKFRQDSSVFWCPVLFLCVVFTIHIKLRPDCGTFHHCVQ